MKLDAEFLRFVGVAGLQAVANYGSYLIVLQFAPWWVAFAVATIIGLSLQTVMQIRATFGQKITFQRSAPYILYQVCYVACFALALKLAIDWGVRAEFAPLVVLVVATPANFLISRLIIKR
jgi:putative flippase GtrA